MKDGRKGKESRGCSRFRFAILVTLALLAMVLRGWAQAPDFAWVAQAGGPPYVFPAGFSLSVCQPLGMALDKEGNVLAVGELFSAEPVFTGPSGTNFAEPTTFLAKFDPAGALLWERSLETNGQYDGVAADNSGNVYVSAQTNVSYFADGLPQCNFLLSKYDGAGNLLWSVTSQGDSEDVGYQLILDSATNIYLSGAFTSSNMLLGSFTLTNGFVRSSFEDWRFESFVAKFDANGKPLWAKAIPGADYGSTPGAKPRLDAEGNLFIVAAFVGPINFGAITLTNIGAEDLCVAKYDPQGNLLWAKDVAYSDSEYPFLGLFTAMDPAGNFYLSGSYQGFTATFGTMTLTNQIYVNNFVAKCDSNANVLWVKQPVGAVGSSFQGGAAFADGAGNVYQIGTYSGDPTIVGGVTLSNSTGASGYVIKYDRDGNIPWIAQINPLPHGNSTVSEITSGFIEGDTLGNIFVCGQFDTPGAAFGQLNATTVNQGEIFFARIDGPRLSAVPGASGIVVSWPTNATGLSLVSATDLTGGNWTAVTNVPAVVGNQFVVTNVVSAGSRFFRLRSF